MYGDDEIYERGENLCRTGEIEKNNENCENSINHWTAMTTRCILTEILDELIDSLA